MDVVDSRPHLPPALARPLSPRVAGVPLLVCSAFMAWSSLLAETALPSPDHLQLWLRADVGAEHTAGRLTRWRDQSGRGNDAAPASPASAPYWVDAAINGQPAVRFDGARTSLRVAHAPGLDPTRGMTVFCVYRYSDGFRVAQKKDRGWGSEPDAWFIGPKQGLGVAGKYGRNVPFTSDTVCLMASVFDAQTGALRVFSNGKAADKLAAVAAPKANSDPLRIGRRYLLGKTQGFLKGEIAELILYNAALTDPDRKRVEQYLRRKYDVRPATKPGIEIVRVLPGRGSVTVEWREPKTKVAAKQLRYRLDLKLRTAAWDNAQSRQADGKRTAVRIEGLMDRADYALRVVAQDAATGKQVGVSHARLVRPGPAPGVLIDYLHKDDTAYIRKGRYIGSPSIAKLPDAALVASHDLFMGGTWSFSRVFRSDDAGETWRHVADLDDAFWGKLFVHRGALYMLACKKRFGDVVLHQSTDGGLTWRKPATLAKGTYHKAPMPIVEHDGRLWSCVELKNGPWGSGFEAAALSAPADADLMEPKNWTVSKPLRYDPAWLPKDLKLKEGAHGYLEGNAVVAPDGRLVDVLRYHVSPYFRKAVVLDIAADGRSLSFNRVIGFYGGMTKFTIRRHPETGVYWSLVNRVTDPTKPAMRSVLTLVRSESLDDWALVRDVLRDDNEMAWKYTAFQYVDWIFDRDDILVASRTAYNGARNFHDANMLTFHRVRGFAEPGMVGP